MTIARLIKLINISVPALALALCLLIVYDRGKSEGFREGFAAAVPLMLIGDGKPFQ